MAYNLGLVNLLLRYDSSGVSIERLSFQQILITLASWSSNIPQPYVSSGNCSAQISLVIVPFLPHGALPYVSTA